MVEMLVALGMVGVGLALARMKYLHPGDYIVVAATALAFAVTVLIAIPPGDIARVIVEMGAPVTARERDSFLITHGMPIVVASIVCAAGYCLAALVRYRITPEQWEWHERESRA
jgi:hypothetical protein